MTSDDCIVGRYRDLALRAAGGMGEVYRAVDVTTGEPVALKLLLPIQAKHAPRFQREIEIVQGLRHPGIVRYLTHGKARLESQISPTGELVPTLVPGADWVLVLEWVEGESLSARLRRSTLRLAESLELVTRIAEAVGEAHRVGVVHRDLKPSNILLDGDSPRAPKVLDFGIARLAGYGTDLTRVGAVLGTPGFMAPEQARGDPDIDARADVFALGCLLFACVTGVRPYSRATDDADLFKQLLVGPPPRVREFRPDLPESLDEAVAELMARSRDDRPADGGRAARLLRTITPTTGAADAPRMAFGITTTERRILCAVVVGFPDGLELDTDTQGTGEAAGMDAATVMEAPEPPIRVLQKWALVHGGTIEVLAPDCTLVLVGTTEVASDLAERAARCAIAIRVALPSANVGLVTGWIDVGRPVLGTELAAQCLAMSRREPERHSSRPPSERISEQPREAEHAARDREAVLLRASPVELDEVSRGLLERTFDVRRRGGRSVLVGHRGRQVLRTLLGKSSPCLGRSRELAILEATLTQCIEDSCSRVVVMTAPAGIGKSRVRFEFVRAVEERGDVEVWISRADGQKSTYGLIASALRTRIGSAVGEQGAAGLARVREFLGELGLAEPRWVELIAHLVGLRPPAETPTFRAALRDRVVMSDQLRDALLTVFDAQLSRRPTLFILEDLHQGDGASVRLIDAMLGGLRERPLMVLALGRPEVREAFPGLFDDRAPCDLRLPPISGRAAHALVTLALGPSFPDAEAIVSRAQGNAFYLEELIRAVSSGVVGSLPDTVLAMAQRRLSEIDSDGRRILRAAAIFGVVFCREGVLSLLGDSNEGAFDRWLEHLVRREVLAPRSTSRYENCEELVFRHALLAEAAYASLTEKDRQLGHALAAEFLVAKGETSAAILAAHYEKSGDAEAAARQNLRAAEQALEGGDWSRALTSVRSAQSFEPAAELAAELYLIEAIAHRNAAHHTEALSAAARAAELFAPSTPGQCSAHAEIVSASGRLGDHAHLERSALELISAHRAGVRNPPLTLGLAAAAVQLLHHGRVALADEMRAAVTEVATGSGDGYSQGWRSRVEGYFALHRGDRVQYLECSKRAAELFEAEGDQRLAVGLLSAVGFAELSLGRYAEAEVELVGARDRAARLLLATPHTVALHNLGLAMALSGRPREGLEVEREAVSASVLQGDRRIEVGARTYLGRILLLLGRYEEAIEEATTVLSFAPAPSVALARAVVVLGHLGMGRWALAHDEAVLALTAVEAHGGEEGEGLVWLGAVRAFRAVQKYDEARVVLQKAQALLRARALRIDSLPLRESYLKNIAEHRELLEDAGAQAELEFESVSTGR